LKRQAEKRIDPMASHVLEQTIAESREAIAEVARGALLRSLNGRAAEIPAVLVDAMASGAGHRTSVLEATRKTFGTEKPLELVLFDTDRIASYVFESSRPPVIAGASTLLRKLNETIARDKYPQAVIFSGGGEGLLLVPAGRGETVCGEIQALYASETKKALSVTTGFLSVGPHDFITEGGEDKTSAGVRLVSGTQAVLSRLRDRVRCKKDERGLEEEIVAGGRERCVSCRDRAEGARRIGDFRDLRDDPRSDGSLCDPCARRWDVGRREIKGISFEELVKASGPEREKAKYIGFLYADGNAMGALFGGLSSLAEIRFLSQAVREVFEKLQSRAKKMAREFAPGTSDDDLPFVSYLGGGDEAIWILPGSLAIHIATQLQRWIEEESRAITDLPQLLLDQKLPPFITFGAGLVLCGYTYPVRYQYDLAKDLQKSAKSISCKSGKPVSAIDFEVLTESSPLSETLKSARVLTDATEEPKFWRSCRPYTAEEFARLLERMGRLRGKGITSQLYALQDGVREGKRIFLNFLCYQIARKPAGTKYQEWLIACKVDPADRKAVERFFIKDLTEASGTWIADGLQLAPFLDWKD
jgi:CRISPR RNA silencing complex Cmr2 subunit-like protein